MNSPMFSIIIPVYNRSDLVSASIQSVLNQSFHEFELILINDGSTDNTLSILEEAQRKDERINVINLKSNQGRCASRNTGLEAANGKWICYLDSDDEYLPNHLETLQNLITSNPEYRAFASEQTINNRKKNYKNKKLNKDLVELTLNDFIEDNPFTANQLCHSIELKVRWSNERIPISEDWLFFRTLTSETPILKSSTLTCNLNVHENRTMTVASGNDFVKYNLMAANKFIQESNCNNQFKKRILSYTLLLCTNVYLKNKQKKDAWNLFKKCITFGQSYTYALFYKAVTKFVLP